MALNAKELASEIYTPVVIHKGTKKNPLYVPEINIANSKYRYRQTLTFKQSPGFLGFTKPNDAFAFAEKEIANMQIIGCYDENIWKS